MDGQRNKKNVVAFWDTTIKDRVDAHKKDMNWSR